MNLKKLGRRRRTSGSEILEVSFVVVPLFGLIFLLLDISMAVFLRTTFQHAVREAVRYGITGQVDSTGTYGTATSYHDDSIKNVVKRHALGFLNSGAAANSIHVHYMSPVDGSQTDNSAGNILQVSIERYAYGPLAPYRRLGMNAQIWARAYDLMESSPGAPPAIHNPE